MKWGLIWLLSSIITGFVTAVSLKSSLIKKIHPSQLIGAMGLMFLLVNWHIFIWKLGEVEIICYLNAHDWWKSLVQLFGGKCTSEEAIKLLVHSNQSLFQITL
jgi:hypothetical protein